MSPFNNSLVRLLCLLMIVAAVSPKPGKVRRTSVRHSRDQRLVSGEPVTGSNYTFLASLRIMPKELHRCGGFLISRHHIMTTASCIYSTGTKELHAYMNPLRLDNLGTYIKVNQVVFHPNFTLTPHENDVAVLTLERSFDSDFPSIPNWVDLPSKSNVLTFGWGYDQISHGVGNFTLHMFKLQVMANGLCSLVLREYLSCDTLCGTSTTPFATSAGDVGTPLIYVGGDRMYVVGMLVKETDDLVNAAPYMRLRKYLEWSEEIMSSHQTSTVSTSTTEGGEAPPEETTTTVEETTTTTTEAPPPDDDYGIFSEDYQEQPIKGHSRKRAAYQRQMFRDAPLMSKRQISRFG